MCDPEDVFVADIYNHSYCCKEYFNKYNLKIAEIMKSLEAKESVAVGNKSLNERFLGLGPYFQNTVYSLSFIRDKPNANSTLSSTVTDRTVKQLINQYGGDVCFTYPSNKRISQMVFSTGRHRPSTGCNCNSAGVEKLQIWFGKELL